MRVFSSSYAGVGIKPWVVVKGKGMVSQFVWNLMQLHTCVAARHLSFTVACFATKWSSGKNMYQNGAKRKQKVVAAYKLRKWEIVSTFGPLLETAAERRRKRRDQVDKMPESMNNVVVRVTEAGFSDIEPLSSANKVVVARVNAEDVGSYPSTVESPYNEGHVLKSLSGISEWKVVTTRKLQKPVVSTANGLEPDSDSSEGVGSVGANHVGPELETLCAFPLTQMGDVTSLVEEFQSWLDTRKAFQTPPSISSILQKTMPPKSTQALENWRARMIAELGMEEFLNYQAEMFRVGQTLHQTIERYMTKKSVEEFQVDESITGYWKSLQTVLCDVSDVYLQETSIEHPFLRYQGVLDCVAKYRDLPMLIEWKTSQRPKTSLRDTFDNPLQAAAYVGALNFTGQLDFQVTRVAIVVAYSSGESANVHILDKGLTTHYWRLWLKRLKEFALLSDPV